MNDLFEKVTVKNFHKMKQEFDMPGVKNGKVVCCGVEFDAQFSSTVCLL